MSANTVWQRLLSFFPEVVKGNSGAAPAVDWTAGTVQSITLNAATVTPTFVAPPGGASLALVVTQDGVGGRAVTWPAAVSWIGGTPPILLSGAGQTTLVYFYFDGATYWGSLQSGASPASIIPWTSVAAGTALAASLAKPNLAADSSGAQSTITLPTAAQMASSDGYEFTIKATGNMASPVIVGAGAGNTIELLNAPGTFGASTWLPIQGQGVVYKYDLATTTWKVRASSEGSGAAGTSAYNPGWYAAATIFIDPAAGVDTAVGTTMGAPLKTYAEASRRWGSNAPALSVASLAIEFLSSHTDNSDPVRFSGANLKTTLVTIFGAVPATTAAVFTRTAQKNRTAGANSLLTGSFSAGAPAAAVRLDNTTAGKASVAWVYKTAGGANWKLSQPIQASTNPFADALTVTEIDTWASLDTVTLSTPTAINFAELDAVVITPNGAATNGLVVRDCVAFDPLGVANSTLYVGRGVCFAQVAFQRTLSIEGGTIQNAAGRIFINCFCQSQIAAYAGFSSASTTFISDPLFIGGVIAGASSQFMGTAGFGSDIIIAVTITLGNGGVLNPALLGGGVYLDGFRIVVQAGLLFNASGIVYGAAGGNLNMLAQSYLANTAGTFTAKFTLPDPIATGILLNGAATGNSIAYAANVGTIHNGIATTVANLDAAAGAAGFGGLAFNPGGATLALAA